MPWIKLTGMWDRVSTFDISSFEEMTFDLNQDNSLKRKQNERSPVKALVLESGKVGLREIPHPLPSERVSLIKVLKAGICNTDLELVKGY